MPSARTTIRGLLLLAALSAPAVHGVRDSDSESERGEGAQERQETGLHQEGAASSILMVTEASKAARQVRVKVLFARQGYQCQEATVSFGKTPASKVNALRMKDPGLTDCGWHQAVKAGEALKQKGVTPEKVDLVLTSSMMSAIETALAMFPGKTVMPLPFLADGSSAEVSEQQKILASDAVKARAQADKAPLDPAWAKVPGFGPVRSLSSFEGFAKFMASNFMPALPEDLQAKDELTFVVIAHGHVLKPLLKTACNRGEELNYAEVVEIPFAFRTYVTAGSGQKEIARAEADPYLADATKAWEDMRALVDAQTLGSKLLPLLDKPKQLPAQSPPTLAYTLGVRRAFEHATGCTVLHPGAAAPRATLCQKDYGKVCEAELATFHSITRPNVVLAAQGQCCVDM